MILKIDGVPTESLSELALFLNSIDNWIPFPTKLRPTGPGGPDYEAEGEAGRKFVRIVRSEEKRTGYHNIVLEIQPYIKCPYTDDEIMVPAGYLLELMQALDLFPHVFEYADHPLVAADIVSAR